MFDLNASGPEFDHCAKHVYYTVPFLSLSLNFAEILRQLLSSKTAYHDSVVYQAVKL